MAPEYSHLKLRSLFKRLLPVQLSKVSAGVIFFFLLLHFWREDKLGISGDLVVVSQKMALYRGLPDMLIFRNFFGLFYKVFRNECNISRCLPTFPNVDPEALFFITFLINDFL